MISEIVLPPIIVQNVAAHVIMLKLVPMRDIVPFVMDEITMPEIVQTDNDVLNEVTSNKLLNAKREIS